MISLINLSLIARYFSTWRFPHRTWPSDQTVHQAGQTCTFDTSSSLRSMGDFYILEFPTAKGLGSSISSWEVYLSILVSPAKLWLLYVAFCLSLTIIDGVYNMHFNTVLLLTAPSWEESCPPCTLLLWTAMQIASLWPYWCAMCHSLFACCGNHSPRNTHTHPRSWNLIWISPVLV